MEAPAPASCSQLMLDLLGAPLIGYSSWYDRNAQQEAKIADFLGFSDQKHNHLQSEDVHTSLPSANLRTFVSRLFARGRCAARGCHASALQAREIRMVRTKAGGFLFSGEHLEDYVESVRPKSVNIFWIVAHLYEKNDRT